MPCGWEGNRRSGVALAKRHRPKWFIHPPTGSRPRQGDEHPAYAVLWSMAHLSYLCRVRVYVCVYILVGLSRVYLPSVL